MGCSEQSGESESVNLGRSPKIQSYRGGKPGSESEELVGASYSPLRATFLG